MIGTAGAPADDLHASGRTHEAVPRDATSAGEGTQQRRAHTDEPARAPALLSQATLAG